MVSIGDGVGSRDRESMTVAAWATVKTELRDINGQWLQSFHDRSVTFRHRRLGHNVKVTLYGEVFIDIKLSDGNYKSEVHKTDLKSAAVFTRQFLQEHV
jgi:hypothetical protein